MWVVLYIHFYDFLFIFKYTSFSVSFLQKAWQFFFVCKIGKKGLNIIPILQCLQNSKKKGQIASTIERLPLIESVQGYFNATS